VTTAPVPEDGDAETTAVLQHGTLTLHGRLREASNLTLAATAELDGVAVDVVYKPVQGERPLWDFPDGTLARREVAAYELAVLLGVAAVPATVLRDGPLGPGMCQRWIDTVEDPPIVDLLPPTADRRSLRTVGHGVGADGGEVVLVHVDEPELRAVAFLDALLNNADRKGGHLLRTPDGAIRGIDHGLTFHVQPKLRTVVWGWAGEPLLEPERAGLATLLERLERGAASAVTSLLEDAEVTALGRRARRLLASGALPSPHGDWPALPWPPF
jgi:uncharacterized repeat protein (TIGR03843 family)